NLIYYAKTGAIIESGDEKVLMMNDGVIHRETLTGDLSVIRFTSYAFDLSAFMSASSDVLLLPKDRTTQYLLNPSPNDKAFQKKPNRYLAELNQRFSEWSYSLVFALIALAVAGDARSHREARIHPLITAIAIALFVRWLGFFAAGKADNVPQYAYMVYGVPIVASAVATWFIVSN
ncbi:MAG: LptF/LptG family permease, partial [Mesorhizobium sp.]